MRLAIDKVSAVMNLRSVSTAASLLLFCGTAASQATKYSVNCNLIGNSPTGQTATLQIRVAHQKVSRFQAEAMSGARRIIILRDLSGSVNQTTTQKLQSEVIRDLIETLSSGDRVALIDFALEPSLDIALADAASFKKAFDDLEKDRPKAHGKTSLYDAVNLALDHLDHTGGFSEGDSLLLLSDGADNSSRVAKKTLASRIINSGVRLYVVEFIRGTITTPEEELGPEEVGNLAQDSGGMVLGVRATNNVAMERMNFNSDPKYDVTPQALEAARNQIVSLHQFIEDYTRFSFELAAPIAKATKFSIEGTGDKAAAKARIICQRFIVPR